MPIDVRDNSKKPSLSHNKLQCEVESRGGQMFANPLDTCDPVEGGSLPAEGCLQRAGTGFPDGFRGAFWLIGAVFFFASDRANLLQEFTSARCCFKVFEEVLSASR